MHTNYMTFLGDIRLDDGEQESLKLLIPFLTRYQRATLNKKGWFSVRGKSGACYFITPSTVFIDGIKKAFISRAKHRLAYYRPSFIRDRNRYGTACINPYYRYEPAFDFMLTCLLLIQANENILLDKANLGGVSDEEWKWLLNYDFDAYRNFRKLHEVRS